jgi:spore maturation protein SpmB
MKLLGQILLVFSAILLAIGAWIHTSAFGKVSAAVAKSGIDAFIGKGLKVLWLQDSTIAMVLAIVFATVAFRPFAASKTVIVLLGLVPVITAALVYHFIGNFVGGHIFLTAGVAAILGGLLCPRDESTIEEQT